MVRVCKVTGLLANDNDAHETERRKRSFITRDYVPSVKPAELEVYGSYRKMYSS